LFTGFIKLFANPNAIQNATKQLDIIMTGGIALYDQLMAIRVPEKPKNWYIIEALPDDAAHALITRLPELQPTSNLVDRILMYTGGHPYLLQYVMAQLEDSASLGLAVTDEMLEDVIAECLEVTSELSDWFKVCVEVMETPEVRAVYTVLSLDLNLGETMSLKQVAIAINAQNFSITLSRSILDRALSVLTYYGFIEYDRASETCTLTSELLRRWFVQNVLSFEERMKVTLDTSGVSPSLYARLSDTLLRCAPVDSHKDLQAIFVDARLSSWGARVTEADNRESRVRSLIELLHDQYSDAGENALVLLLRVLSDQTPSGDACHRELAELAHALETSEGRSV
jgi:hypothetical protein